MKLEKSIPILMIFLVLIISIGATSAAEDASENETLAVDEIALDDNLKESPTDTLSEVENKTFTDLNTDIADKAVADLESNYVYSEGDSAYANGITIDRELTINGNGKTTLNPNGNLLFNVGENGKLTLNDLTIVNSYTKPDAMIQNSGTLILNNVTFTAERHILSSVSSATQFITIQNDGVLLVNNSVFKDSNIYSDNIAKSTSISIYGLIYNTNHTTIENTIFDNNKLFNPTTNQLGRTIDICAILHNKNNMLLKNVIIQNTNVSYVPYSNNHFEGILFNEKGKLEINGSIIKDNTIYFPNTENANLKGVIYSEDSASELIISDSIIADNINIQKTNSKPMIDAKGTANLNNNYWGTNTPKFSELISSGATPTTHVNLTFTPEEVTTGEEKTFEITFKLNDAIITTLPNYTITVNSNKLGSKDVEIENGVGQYKYLPITAGEDTITINGEEYTITVNAAPAGSFTDLKDLIDANDEIALYANYTYQSSDSALQTGIPIAKEVTINGNGYTISSSASQLFDIASTGKLTLKNVTLYTDYALDSPTTNGNIINNGVLNLDGAIITSMKTSTAAIAATIFNSGTLNINNTRLINSVSNYTGASTSAVSYGFIYNNATTTIENTIISNNKIETNCCQTVNAYGLIYNNQGNLNLNNVNFTDNLIKETSAQNSNRVNIYGLIYSNNDQDSGNLIIDNCNFENTKIIGTTGDDISEFASVIYSISGNNEIKISNSKFINNTIESNQGALYGAIYTSTKADISNSIFESNTGKESGAIYSSNILTIENSIFRANTADNGIYTTNTATISNSILENNIVSGCVIYNTGALNSNNNYWGTNNPDFAALINNGIPDKYAIITIEGETDLIPESTATYTLNFKTNDTNVICELPDYTVGLSATNPLSDEHVTISKGTATFTYTASLDEMTDTIKASVGSAEKASLEVSVKEDPAAKGTYAELDRLIRKTTDELDLGKDYTFDSANDTGFENGITIDKSITINGHGFKINSTDLAKLFNVVDGGNLTLKDVVLVTDYIYSGTYNTARPEAGFKNLGIVTLNNVTFTTNQNNPSTLAAFAAPIYNTKTLNIVNSKFVNSNINTNSQYCFGLIDNNGGTLNIENTLFDSNSLIDNSTMSSTYLTCLIYNMGTLTLNGVNMTNNYVETPNTGRGLIRAYTNSKVTIDNSIFENNTVYSKSSNAAGTAIYAESGTMTIANSKFINNTGAISGGAVYSSIAITFENNTFEKNNASSYGGAIYGGTNSIYINNTFKQNKAEQGGALYSSGSLQSSKSYPFTKNTFIDNYARKYGGAIYSGAIGTAQYPIENNVFINNEALEKGGAIYSTGAVRVTKTVFQENTAGEGVAIYTTSSTACQITYTIFDNNIIKSPTGGLLYVRGGSTAEDNYWGTNTPNFEDLIKVSGGSLTIPTNIALIVIEGNETLFESDVYAVSFKGNTSKEIMTLPDYTVNITSDINTVTPASVVISNGEEATFTYNVENYGQDTIKVSKNNVEKANLAINVPKPKETPEFTLVAGNITYGESLNFTFTVTKGPSGENVYKWAIFSKFGIPMENGNVTQDNKIISKNSYSAGNYTILVSLSDNEDWNDLEVSDTYEIKQLATEIRPTVTVYDNDTVEIQVDIISAYENNIGGEVSCEIDIPYIKEVENGKATIITNKLSPNKYTITLNYTGDVNYLANATEIEFTIKKTVSDEAFNITKAEDNKTYTFGIKLPSDAKGNLTVKIGEETETRALENGQTNITITVPCGLHEIKLTYSGDENYKQATNMSTIYIPGEKMPEDAKNATMDIPEGTTSPEFTINLPENATGEFTVYVDGTPYTEKLVNGSATVKVPDLSVGNHTISTAYSGDENYEGFETANKTVDIPKASIPGGDSILNPTTPEGSDSPTYSISLPGATGNLTVTVDGKDTYTSKLENGNATVTVPKLAPGKHTITVAYTGDGKFSNISKTTPYTVKAPVIKITKNKDITMLYTAKTPYKVLVTVDGKAVVGEYVAFKFNGKTYKIKTDKNGYATLKLPDVKPQKAKYTITAEYKGVKVSNKVKVNSIIKAKNAKVKKSKKVNKIKVTLKKVNSKFPKGKKLTLKIKGKKIKAKTNKKGVATFKIKKNVLKKLKAGKKYKYTVTFGKDTVTKKLTVKK